MTHIHHYVSIAALACLLCAPVSAQKAPNVNEAASEALSEKLMPKFERTRSLKAPVASAVPPSDTVHFPVEFDSNSAVLRPQGKKQLDLLAESMSKVREKSRSLIANSQKLVLHLVGHTDDRGSDEHNDELSRERAESAKEYLRVTWGFSDAEMTTDFKGKRAPVNAAQPCDITCLQQNRRVDIQVVVK